ncbi:MAG: enolase C-terminal domain-like protein [Planctomycetota bacterium]
MTLFALAYELPFARPVVWRGVEHDARRGWWLRREDADGDRYADACPLPGVSVETFEDVERALFGNAPLPPSLSFALSTLDDANEAEVAVETAALVEADEPLPAGYGTCKLKVGRLRLAEDLERVSRAARTGVRLRLDGNRALSLDAAERLAAAAGAALEFLEEPVAAAELAAALQRLPVALDETLAEVDEPPSGAVAWVVKPVLLGARRAQDLAVRARVTDVDLVVSSAYESAVGRRALVRLAARVAPAVVHGLGTGGAFARDVPGVLRSEGAHLIAAPRIRVATDERWLPVEREDLE